MSSTIKNSYICDYCKDITASLEPVPGDSAKYEHFYSHINQNGKRHVFHKICAQQNFDMITCPICSENFQPASRGAVLILTENRYVYLIPSCSEFRKINCIENLTDLELRKKFIAAGFFKIKKVPDQGLEQHDVNPCLTYLSSIVNTLFGSWLAKRVARTVAI